VERRLQSKHTAGLKRKLRHKDEMLNGLNWPTIHYCRRCRTFGFRTRSNLWPVRSCNCHVQGQARLCSCHTEFYFCFFPTADLAHKGPRDVLIAKGGDETRNVITNHIFKFINYNVIMFSNFSCCSPVVLYCQDTQLNTGEERVLPLV
jgi:hypothetical protein